MKKSIIISLLFVFLKVTFSFGQDSVAASEPGYLSSRPPAIPLMVSPENESPDLEEPVPLVWRGQIHTYSYTIQVSKYADFSSLFLSEEILSDSSYVLSGLEPGTIYYWRVAALNIAGLSNFSEGWSFNTFSSALNIRGNTHRAVESLLEAPNPNPFHLSTNIKYHLPVDTKVSMHIYNSQGQLVKALISAFQPSGSHMVKWDGKDNFGTSLPGGLYICFLFTPGQTSSHKLLLQR